MLARHQRRGKTSQISSAAFSVVTTKIDKEITHPKLLNHDQVSLTKLMVSHDLSRSTITNQIAFDQRDLYSTPEFERSMDHRCQGLVSKLET